MVLFFLVLFNDPIYAVDISYNSTRTFGDTGADQGNAVGTDSNNNIYYSGRFSGTVDFDNGTGIDNHISNGNTDVYLTKYDIYSNHSWTISFGDTGADQVFDLIIDTDNNVYITGSFYNTIDFDYGAGTDNHTSNGNKDVFVTKYSSTGEHLWTQTFGGTAEERGLNLTLDSAKNVFVSGGSYSASIDFDPGAGDDTKSLNGNYDRFYSKFTSDGLYLFSGVIGSSEADGGRGIAIDSSDNIIVTGSFAGSTDFDPGAQEDLRDTNGNLDMFITKVTSDNSYLWTKTIGSTGLDTIYDLTIDSGDNIVVTGSYRETVDFDPGPGTDYHTFIENDDGFIGKYDNNGNFIWARSFKGNSLDIGNRVATDSRGNIYTIGYFMENIIFDNSSNGVNRESQGGFDFLFVVYDSSGNFQFAQTDGSAQTDFGLNIFIDSSDNIYTTGYFAETIDFNPFDETDLKTSSGGSDAFFSIFTTSMPTETTNSDAAPYDPNMKQGWVKKILAGPNYSGVVIYIEDSAVDGVSLLIPNEASSIDLHVNFEQIPVEQTINITDVSVPFPWSQGRNTVSSVFNINAQAAFNGNTVESTENPFIITLNYDPEKLYSLKSNILKITKFDTTTGKWNVVNRPHVVNEGHSTISTTTTDFGYHTVTYPASVW